MLVAEGAGRVAPPPNMKHPAFQERQEDAPVGRQGGTCQRMRAASSAARQTPNPFRRDGGAPLGAILLAASESNAPDAPAVGTTALRWQPLRYLPAEALAQRS